MNIIKKEIKSDRIAMTEENDTCKPGRLRNGRFKKGVSGNPGGGKHLTTELRQALKQYEQETGQNFLRHYFARAFKSDAVARDVASRLYPALKAMDATIDGNIKSVTDILAAMGIGDN